MMPVVCMDQGRGLAAKSCGTLRVNAVYSATAHPVGLLCKNDAIGAVKVIAARPMAATVVA